jgi:hypothetical protein
LGSGGSSLGNAHGSLKVAEDSQHFLEPTISASRGGAKRVEHVPFSAQSLVAPRQKLWDLDDASSSVNNGAGSGLLSEERAQQKLHRQQQGERERELSNADSSLGSLKMRGSQGAGIAEEERSSLSRLVGSERDSD